MTQHDIDQLRVASRTCLNISMTLSEEPQTLTRADIAEIREQLLVLRRNLRYVHAN